MQRFAITDRLLLRPEEAAALTGLGRTTIYELMRSGELRSINVGRARRIPRVELERWVSERMEAADDEAA